MPDKGSVAEKTDKPEKAEKEKAEKPAASARATSIPPPKLDELVQTGERPSLPPLPASGPWRSYKEIVSGLAARIVEAQKPLRVLQAIRWDNGIEEQFTKTKYKELPKIDATST